MSKMYGKRRVVLSRPNTWGMATVAVCGVAEGHTGGDYSPMGRWYRDSDGLFYVDLKSNEQEYRPVKWGELAHKHRGGFRTKADLRTFVMRIDRLRWELYLLAREGKPTDYQAAELTCLLGDNYEVPKYQVYTPAKHE